MNLALLADDAYTFLLSWEFMSLASWALVMAHHREADNPRAGLVYIVMASFGAFALLLALRPARRRRRLLRLRRHARASADAGVVAAVVLALALFGAGSKAGLAPLHVWLPLAHPAAPSHVSALMSGVMTKVAVYAFIRIVFDLVGPADWRWGVPSSSSAPRPRPRRPVRVDGDRHQARARLFDHREYRPRLHRPRPVARLSRPSDTAPPPRSP